MDHYKINFYLIINKLFHGSSQYCYFRDYFKDIIQIKSIVCQFPLLHMIVARVFDQFLLLS